MAKTEKRKFGLPSVYTRRQLRKMRKSSEHNNKTANGGWECRGYRCSAPRSRGARGGGFTVVWGYLANNQTRSKGR